MDNKRIFALSILVVALSIAFYFVIFLPQKERERQAAELLKQSTEQKAEEDRKQIFKNCATEAHDKARNLLKNKIELMQNGQERSTMQEAYDKGLYLKDDYNSYYDNCLKENGISE